MSCDDLINFLPQFTKKAKTTIETITKEILGDHFG